MAVTSRLRRCWAVCIDGCFEAVGYVADALDKLARFLGPLLIILGACIILSNTFYFFQRILPYYTTKYSAAWLCLAMWGSFLLVNIVYNYVVCIAFDPGRTAGHRSAAQMTAALGDSVTRSLPPQPPHEMRWCEPCNAPKPRRVHHCSVCDTCVMKMDHHCPWVNNCVGSRTYPYFVRMLAWLEIGCWFVTIMGGMPLYRVWPNCGGSVALPVTVIDRMTAAVTAGLDENTVKGKVYAALARVSSYFLGTDPWGCPRGFLLSYALAVALAVSLSFLFGWHIYLAGTGQTSIEFYKNSEAENNSWVRGKVYRHEFDAGSFGGNWEAVFGTRHWLAWLLPPSWLRLAAPPGLGEALGCCRCLGRARSRYYRALGRPSPVRDEEDDAGRSEAAAGHGAGAPSSQLSSPYGSSIKQRVHGTRQSVNQYGSGTVGGDSEGYEGEDDDDDGHDRGYDGQP